MSERDKLIEELNNKAWCTCNPAYVADFILADRKRIVKPFVELLEISFKADPIVHKAIDKTLRNAGLE